ncbi:hypothetical protein CH063_00662, partial [Colletotrichum higginsianum]
VALYRTGWQWARLWAGQVVQSKRLFSPGSKKRTIRGRGSEDELSVSKQIRIWHVKQIPLVGGGGRRITTRKVRCQMRRRGVVRMTIVGETCSLASFASPTRKRIDVRRPVARG